MFISIVNNIKSIKFIEHVLDRSIVVTLEWLKWMWIKLNTWKCIKHITIVLVVELSNQSMFLLFYESNFLAVINIQQRVPLFRMSNKATIDSHMTDTFIFKYLFSIDMCFFLFKKFFMYIEFFSMLTKPVMFVTIFIHWFVMKMFFPSLTSDWISIVTL